MCQIASVNDSLRKSLPFLPLPHRLHLSSFVAHLPEGSLCRLFGTIRSFETFGRNNDPYREHDYGIVEVEGDRYIWKFDYFDVNKHQKIANLQAMPRI